MIRLPLRKIIIESAGYSAVICQSKPVFPQTKALSFSAEGFRY